MSREIKNECVGSTPARLFAVGLMFIVLGCSCLVIGCRTGRDKSELDVDQYKVDFDGKPFEQDDMADQMSYLRNRDNKEPKNWKASDYLFYPSEKSRQIDEHLGYE